MTVIIFGIMDWNSGCEVAASRTKCGEIEQAMNTNNYTLTDSSDPTYSTIDVRALQSKKMTP